MPVIKGLLKGCAEQNALGAFAASGHAFEQIRGVVICSLSITSSRSSAKHPGDAAASPPTATVQQIPRCARCCAFPCTACRSYLGKVQAFVAARHGSRQLLRLACVALELPASADYDAAADAVGAGAESGGCVVAAAAPSQFSVDCVAGWSSEFRQAHLIEVGY